VPVDCFGRYDPGRSKDFTGRELRVILVWQQACTSAAKPSMTSNRFWGNKKNIQGLSGRTRVQTVRQSHAVSQKKDDTNNSSRLRHESKQREDSLISHTLSTIMVRFRPFLHPFWTLDAPSSA
jgi:hypothetical protein